MRPPSVAITDRVVAVQLALLSDVRFCWAAADDALQKMTDLVVGVPPNCCSNPPNVRKNLAVEYFSVSGNVVAAQAL
jgi:hypothetical protein